MLRTYLAWILTVAVSVHCFQRLQQRAKGKALFSVSTHHTQQIQQTSGVLFPPKIKDQVALQDRRGLKWDLSSIQSKECRCPLDDDPGKNEDDDDVISDLGEAAFAMLGSLWAQGDGKIIPTSLLFPDAPANRNDEVWTAAQYEHDEALTRTRIRAVLESLTNHPYANEANLDTISAHVVQRI